VNRNLALKLINLQLIATHGLWVQIRIWTCINNMTKIYINIWGKLYRFFFYGTGMAHTNDAISRLALWWLMIAKMHICEKYAFDQLIEEPFSTFDISNIYNMWTGKSEVVFRGVGFRNLFHGKISGNRNFIC
jgi:hypothetical protein